MKLKSLPGPPTLEFLILFLWHLIPLSFSAASSSSLNGFGVPFETPFYLYTPASINDAHKPIEVKEEPVVVKEEDDIEYIVSIPPLLDKGPPQGELLFTVIHDPEQEPENLTIPCRADALPTPSYSWFKNGHHFSTDDDNVVMISGEGTIVFENPRPEDEGDYQCVATNAAGSVYSNIANVRRSITISFPKGEPRVATVALGDSLSLKCSNPGGYPKPSLHWVLQKSDASLRSVSSERATVDDEGTLWFSSVTLEDASEDSLYACAASSATSEQQLFVVEEDGTMQLRTVEPNEGDFISLNILTEYRMGNWVFLNVTVPPLQENGDRIVTIRSVPPFEQHVSSDIINVLKGEDLRLFCIHGGQPVPNVKWWREGKKKIADEHLVEFDKVLEFLDSDHDIAGKYFCQASNDVGNSQTHTFNIIVEAAPEFTSEPGTINQPIGETATFSCLATGVPEPIISWSFNGEPLNHNEDTYTLEDLAITDRGVIACNASNKHGYVYSTGFINVLMLPPEFIESPTNSSSFIGDAVIFICKGYGSPDPDIQWSKSDGNDGFEEIENNKYYIVGEESLTIKSLSESTAGTYECRAVNRYGVVETKVTVNVIESTKVNLEISEKNVKAGEEVTLRCSVSADKVLNPEITWVKDEKAIDFTDNRLEEDEDSSNEEDNYDRVLVISNSRGSDSGTYSCIAKTKRDEITAYVILTVEDVPDASTIANVECSTREAYIKWNPGSVNNSPLVGYKIEMQTWLDRDRWDEISNDILGSADSAKIELNPGLKHSFRVIAVNHVGESEPSKPSKVCTASSAPPDSNPDNVKADNIDSSTIKVTWDSMQPIDHNGPDFHYEIQWRVHDDDSPDDDDDSWSEMIVNDWEQAEAELEELTPYTKYEIKVHAVNEKGKASDSGSVIEVTEADVPVLAPTLIEIVEVKAKSAILTWLPLESEHIFGPLKGYEINMWKTDDGTKEDEIIVNGEASTFSFEDFQPFTTYSVKVRVLNDLYAGPYSETVTFTTSEYASSPVMDLKGRSSSANSILVDWDVPSDPNGILTGYTIKYRTVHPDSDNDGDDELGPEEQIIKEIGDQPVKIFNLKEETTYEISVYATNQAGLGVGSTIEIHTENVVPSRPAAPIFNWEILESEYEPATEKRLSDAKKAAILNINQNIVVGDRDGDGDVDKVDESTKHLILKDSDGDGDVDMEDVLDTDNDGDIDDYDLAVADINNDGTVTEYDVSAADKDGDGDVDIYDIGDVDGDGDFDAGDVIAADVDDDGDIDLADEGRGASVRVNWKPDIDSNAGSAFFLKYRALGHKYWRKTNPEGKYLHQTLDGLDPYSAYEIQMIATDGKFQALSDTKVFGPFRVTPGPPTEERFQKGKKRRCRHRAKCWRFRKAKEYKGKKIYGSNTLDTVLSESTEEEGHEIHIVNDLFFTEPQEDTEIPKNEEDTTLGFKFKKSSNSSQPPASTKKLETEDSSATTKNRKNQESPVDLFDYYDSSIPEETAKIYHFHSKPNSEDPINNIKGEDNVPEIRTRNIIDSNLTPTIHEFSHSNREYYKEDSINVTDNEITVHDGNDFSSSKYNDEEVFAKVDSLEFGSSLDGIDTRTVEMNNTLNVIDNRIEKITNSLDTFNSRTDDIDNSLDVIDIRIDEIGNSLDGIQIRIDEIQTSLYDVIISNELLVKKKSKQKRSLDSIFSQTEMIERSLNEIDKRSDIIKNRLKNIQKRSLEIARKLDFIVNRMSQISGSLSGLGKRTDRLKNSLDSIAGRTDVVKLSVDNISGQTDIIKQSFDGISNRTDSVVNSIDELERRISSITSTFDDFDKQTNKIEKVISNFESITHVDPSVASEANEEDIQPIFTATTMEYELPPKREKVNSEINLNFSNMTVPSSTSRVKLSTEPQSVYSMEEISSIESTSSTILKKQKVANADADDDSEFEMDMLVSKNVSTEIISSSFPMLSSNDSIANNTNLKNIPQELLTYRNETEFPIVSGTKTFKPHINLKYNVNDKLTFVHYDSDFPYNDDESSIEREQMASVEESIIIDKYDPHDEVFYDEIKEYLKNKFDTINSSNIYKENRTKGTNMNKESFLELDYFNDIPNISKGDMNSQIYNSNLVLDNLHESVESTTEEEDNYDSRRYSAPGDYKLQAPEAAIDMRDTRRSLFEPIAISDEDLFKKPIVEENVKPSIKADKFRPSKASSDVHKSAITISMVNDVDYEDNFDERKTNDAGLDVISSHESYQQNTNRSLSDIKRLYNKVETKSQDLMDPLNTIRTTESDSDRYKTAGDLFRKAFYEDLYSQSNGEEEENPDISEITYSTTLNPSISDYKEEHPTSEEFDLLHESSIDIIPEGVPNDSDGTDIQSESLDESDYDDLFVTLNVPTREGDVFEFSESITEPENWNKTIFNDSVIDYKGPAFNNTVSEYGAYDYPDMNDFDEDLETGSVSYVDTSEASNKTISEVDDDIEESHFNQTTDTDVDHEVVSNDFLESPVNVHDSEFVDNEVPLDENDSGIFTDVKDNSAVKDMSETGTLPSADYVT